MIIKGGLGCASCFGTCSGELGDLTPNYATGAMYGPINGQYVTLNVFQAWQASQTSANQNAYETNMQAIQNAIGTSAGSSPATVNVSGPTTTVSAVSTAPAASSIVSTDTEPWYEETADGIPIWLLGLGALAGAWYFFQIKKGI